MKSNAQVFGVATGVLAILVWLRLHALPAFGLPDYDTVENWLVAKEISSGDFTRFYHHRAPLFHLFIAALYQVLPTVKGLISCLAIIQAAAVILFSYTLWKRTYTAVWVFGLMSLCIGSCVFLVHNARYLSIDVASFPVVVVVLICVLKRYEQQHFRYLVFAIFGLALGIAINYKLLLFIPALLLIELLQPVRFKKQKYAIALMVFILPFAMLSLFGWLAGGLKIYQYLASYVGVTRFHVPNAAMRTGKFQGDVSFYFRYLFSFESPLVWVGLLMYPMLYKPWQRLRQQPLVLADLLAAVCLCQLVIFSVLLKAPRGLLVAYAPLYGLGLLCILKLTINHKWLFALTSVASIVYCGLQIQQEVYRYTGNGYAQLAVAIKNQPIRRVLQTVGNGLNPALEGSNIQVESVIEIQKNKMQGAWVVDDPYRIVANVKGFAQLKHMPAIATISDSAFLSKLFFLEHAEFTGMGYSQTMQLRQKLLKRGPTLRLVQLP